MARNRAVVPATATSKTCRGGSTDPGPTIHRYRGARSRTYSISLAAAMGSWDSSPCSRTWWASLSVCGPEALASTCRKMLPSRS